MKLLSISLLIYFFDQIDAFDSFWLLKDLPTIIQNDLMRVICLIKFISKAFLIILKTTHIRLHGCSYHAQK